MTPTVIPIETKCCSRCKERKPLTEFYARASASDGLHSWCKRCFLQGRQERKAANPDRAAAWDRRAKYKWRYGITVEDYDAMFEAQNGLCAICGLPPRTPQARLHVDHCRDTERVRGLLCQPCNTAIGLLRHSTAYLSVALQYLAR
jgi:hypothetical protein